MGYTGAAPLLDAIDVYLKDQTQVRKNTDHE